MEKRKLGEQWIEELDGKKHMLKAVKPVELCQGCLYNSNGGGCWWSGFDDECEMGSRFIIKDLGILKDGRLPCPFCGEYPFVESYKVDGWYFHYKVYCSNKKCDIRTHGENEQQAIDAWNRRA